MKNIHQTQGTACSFTHCVVNYFGSGGLYVKEKSKSQAP